MGKSIRSFVGSELSFLILVSVLVGLSGGVSNFSSKPAQPKLLLLRSNVCFGLQTGIEVVPGQIHA